MNPPRFSNFFKRVVVEIKRDESLYPNSNLVEWNKTPGMSECDGFEIKRSGDSDVPVKILLFPDYHPDKFTLSPPLSQLLDIHTDTMSNVLIALWQYVKLHRLLDSEDKRCINCDDALKNVSFIFYTIQIYSYLVVWNG